MLGNMNQTKNNGNRQTEYNPTVYSKYTFTNGESTLDRSRLTFSMFGGLLKVTVTPLYEGSNEGDKNAALSIHLSVPKAYMLLREIEKYQQDKETGANTNFFYGVDTPKGLIGITRGDQFGLPATSDLIVLRSINEDGTVNSNYAYELKTNGYYYAIENFRENDRSFDKVEDYNNLEIELVKKQLSEYVNAMSMAIAYSVVDGNKYNESNTWRSLNQIKQAMGLEKGGNRTGGASNFFRNGGIANENSAPIKPSYGSVSDAIGPDDDSMIGGDEDVII